MAAAQRTVTEEKLRRRAQSVGSEQIKHYKRARWWQKQLLLPAGWKSARVRFMEKSKETKKVNEEGRRGNEKAEEGTREKCVRRRNKS